MTQFFQIGTVAEFNAFQRRVDIAQQARQNGSGAGFDKTIPTPCIARSRMESIRSPGFGTCS